MSVLPLFSLFYSVTARIAEHFFESGEAAIEAGSRHLKLEKKTKIFWNFPACHHIDTWQQPHAGRTIELPLLGTLISCRLPAACDLPYEFRLDGHVEVAKIGKNWKKKTRKIEHFWSEKMSGIYQKIEINRELWNF